MTTDTQTVEWLKLAVGLVGLSSGLLTILTLVLRKTVLKERKASKERQEEIHTQALSLAGVYRDFMDAIRGVRSDLEVERKAIQGLRKDMSEHFNQLDAVRKAFGGYFDTTRKQLEMFEGRLKVVEHTSDQLIKVGKKMAARIRGKAGD